MDETEALCTKICILINGKFVCIGTPTHLKNKFAQGYTLIVHLKHLPDGNFPDIEPILEYIKKRFQSISVKYICCVILLSLSKSLIFFQNSVKFNFFITFKGHHKRKKNKFEK